MKRSKILKVVLSLVVGGLLMGLSVGYFLYKTPHRDIAKTRSDYQIAASSLVAEYLAAPEAADAKYLDENGESKVIEVKGVIASITKDFNNQPVVLLKSKADPAGVSCTFGEATATQADQLAVGQLVAIKGVIRSGASYDEDLGMYEHVILEKCSLQNVF